MNIIQWFAFVILPIAAAGGVVFEWLASRADRRFLDGLRRKAAE